MSAITDLPPRTWRGWWLAWPKWLRIGFGALITLGFFQFLLLIRMIVGLRESAEIQELRTRGATIEYVWERERELFSGHHILLAGVYGRSWPSVIQLNATGTMSDSVLERVAAHCSRLEVLRISRSDVSPQVISGLRNCRQLQILDISDTDADDTAISQLSALHRLEDLDVSGTFLTDAALPSLKKLKALSSVDLSFTDVSDAAAHSWQAECLRNPDGHQQRIAKVGEGLGEPVRGLLLWSDGSRSTACVGPRFDFRMYDSHETREENLVSKEIGNCLTRQTLSPNLAEIIGRHGDGDYQLTLTLGMYSAEPIKWDVINGRPSIDAFEFRMPCTKAEVLRSSVSDKIP